MNDSIIAESNHVHFIVVHSGIMEEMKGGERLESHGSGGASGHVSTVVSIGVRENEGEAPIFFRQCVRLKQWAFDDVIVPSS